jgi:hypothetical protein
METLSNKEEEKKKEWKLRCKSGKQTREGAN